MAFSFSKADPQESWIGDNFRPGTEVRQILSQGYRVTVCLYDLLFETEIGILLPE
jgi:hypothetical protein